MDQNFLYGMSFGLGLSKTDRTTDLGTLTAAKNLSAGDSEFQKLLERAQNPQDVEQPKPAQSTQKPKEQPKTETKQEKPAADGEDAPQKTEDPGESSELLAESGAVLVPIDLVLSDTESGFQTPAMLLGQENGEYPVAMLNGRFVQQNPQGNVQVEANGGPQTAAQPVMNTEIPVEVEPAAQVQTEEQLQTEIQTAQTAQPQAEQTEAPVQRMETPEAEVQTGDHAQSDEENAAADAESVPQPLFRDVEAAPVKVGEAAYTPEQTAETQDVSTQISSQLTQALEQGASRVEIQLTPESLGRVTVEITQTPDGMLHIALNAERSETRGLLEKHAANLQMILGRGQEPVQVEVQRQEESQQNQNQQNPYDGHSGNQQSRQEQQEQHRQQHPQQSQDFFHQLRLGLVSVEADIS